MVAGFDGCSLAYGLVGFVQIIEIALDKPEISVSASMEALLMIVKVVEVVVDEFFKAEDHKPTEYALGAI